MRKILITIIIIGLVLGGWEMAFTLPKKNEKKKEEAIAKAEEFEANGYYKDAILIYQQLLSSGTDSEISRHIVMDYLAMEDYKMFSREAATYLASNPDEEIYANLITYYFDKNDNNSAMENLEKAEKDFPDSEVIMGLKNRMDGEFNLSYTEFTEVTDFVDGYAVGVLEDGSKYLLDKKGKITMNRRMIEEVIDIRGISESGTSEELIKTDTGSTSYETNAAESVVMAAVTVDNGKTDMETASEGVAKSSESNKAQLGFFDENGNSRAVETGNMEEVYVCHEGKILASANGKWGYAEAGADKGYDISGAELSYDDASVYCNGVAAVKKGDKYALIGKDGNELTRYDYSEVKMDGYRNASRGGAVFAKLAGEGSFALIDLDGTVLSEERFDDVRGFLGKNGVAAVNRDGRWGAIDNSGNLILDFEYDELKSSETDYIPYRAGELWGYISKDGRTLIEPQFEDALAVSEYGYGWVKKNGAWQIITVYSIKGEDGLFDF